MHCSFVIKILFCPPQSTTCCIAIWPSWEFLCLSQKYNMGCRLDIAQLNLWVKWTSSLLHLRPGCASLYTTQMIRHQYLARQNTTFVVFHSSVNNSCRLYAFRQWYWDSTQQDFLNICCFPFVRNTCPTCSPLIHPSLSFLLQLLCSLCLSHLDSVVAQPPGTQCSPLNHSSPPEGLIT